MAVAQQASQLQADASPLWLPRHEAIVVEQSAARPPDFVEGYTLQDRVMTMFLGSRWKMITAGATALCVVLFFVLLPSLLGAGIGGLLKLSIYHLWTVGLMLAATARVRSVTLGSLARYWFVGLFSVFMLTYLVAHALGTSSAASWVSPLVFVVAVSAVLGAALYLGRRLWRHPGISDFMMIGFTCGAGYEFHTAGAWDMVSASGFGMNLGLFSPSIVQANGLFSVGPAVWTSILGLVVGLAVLHRQQPFAVVGAGFTLCLAVADVLSLSNAESLSVARKLVIDGKLLGLVFLVGVVAALVLDHRRLSATAARDHLFPSDRSHGARVILEEGDADDLLKPLLAGRYRRLRNGVHNTVEGTTQQWPPRSEVHPAPLAELARLGRAADVAVGPGTSSSGWAPDPETPAGHRFVGPFGFTAYAAGDNFVTQPFVPELVSGLDDADLDAEARNQLLEEAAQAFREAEAVAHPTTVSISTPKARREAVGVATLQRPAEFLQFVGLGIVAVVLFVGVRLLTAGDPTAFEAIGSTDIAMLSGASPAIIRGLLGAVVAAVALRGRNAAVVGAGSEVGPGDDPRPTRPAECEA